MLNYLHVHSETPKTLKKFKVKEEIRENSRNLLKHSNICLFKSLKNRYQCYSCKAVFIKILDLREHSKAHSIPHLSGNVYKNADISSLKCNLCSEKCADLTVLMNHLKNMHAIKFTSTEHMFIPYKLEEGFRCVLCQESFKTFLWLLMHMNKHSTNHVCETCGLSYYNSINLRTHRYFLHKFSKKCSMCDVVFIDQQSRMKHMRVVHKKEESLKRYCLLCDKTFKYGYLLQEHKIKDHGVERPVSECKDCCKTFLTPQNLKTHMRSVHVMERNFVCDICGMRFFTKTDQKRHLKRHEDIKSFCCSYCDTKFKSKDSWTRHQRNKHNLLLKLSPNKK